MSPAPVLRVPSQSNTKPAARRAPGPKIKINEPKTLNLGWSLEPDFLISDANLSGPVLILIA